MLSQRDSEKYRKILNARLRELVSGIVASKAEIEKAEDASYADPTDVASAEVDKTMQLKMRDRDKVLIEEIERALQRIEARTYGGCLSCGERISDSRLKARPTTTLCIDCMTEREVGASRHR